MFFPGRRWNVLVVASRRAEMLSLFCQFNVFNTNNLTYNFPHLCFSGKKNKPLTTVRSVPFLFELQIRSWLVSDQYTRSVAESKSRATMLRPSRTSERTTLGCAVMSSCTIWFRLATSKNACRESACTEQKIKNKSQTSNPKPISPYQPALASKNSAVGPVNRADSNGRPRECTPVQIGTYCITGSFSRSSVL